MLINKSHGSPIEQSGDRDGGPFDYFFPSAPDAIPGKTEALDALAAIMVDNAEVDDGNSKVPAAYTYFGQFIDHDVTANTDRETLFSSVDGQDIKPAKRAEVAKKVQNLRTGALELDSLYGDRAPADPSVRRLVEMLRHPTLRAKMRLGSLEDQGLGRPPLPEDPAADLLRLGRLLEEPHQQITAAEVRAFPAPLRDAFVNEDGSLRLQRAIIGDSRNDENLAVAQFHVAMLRTHNKMVDAIGNKGGDSKTFEAARRYVRWTYQWLVVNDYLPRVCGEAVVREVLEKGAPLYRAFARRVGGTGANAPMPLEFSVAAFRFGHTMVRPSYDWSRFFGRPEGGARQLKPRASFADLFRFTGNGDAPLAVPGRSSALRLPSHWPVEWGRLLDETGPTDRFARRFDTRLAPDLGDMFNEGGMEGDVLRMLARRNLRRGYRLNLPSGQACVSGVHERIGVEIPALDSDALLQGAAGDVIRDSDFLFNTPLWFYLLKEAETLGQGLTLGPLGARLVAETLIGLILADKSSYWFSMHGEAGSWRPIDSPAGDVRTLADLFHFAGVA